MNTQSKKNMIAASLYLTLAVMIVTVVCVAVVSVAKKAKDSLPTEPATTVQPPQTQPTKPSDAPSAPATEPTEPPTKPVETTPEPVIAPNEPEDQPVDNTPDDSLPEKFVVPAMGYVCKAYEGDLPVWSVTMEDYRIHDGIDVACAVGDEIYACADGTVESIYEDPLMGYAVTVYHGGGLRSTYLNMSDAHPGNLTEGTPVAAGQVIGYVGTSALIECAEPEHLHLVMTMDEQTVDPLDYIEYEGAVSADALDFEG